MMIEMFFGEIVSAAFVIVSWKYFVIWCLSILYFFFFSSRRRHTRSKRDWSSDVCSSDLLHVRVDRALAHHRHAVLHLVRLALGPHRPAEDHHGRLPDRSGDLLPAVQRRSEERRVGKECRSRWATDH